MNERELKRFSSYKDLAYRSLKYLYDKVGEEKLNDWLETWFNDYYSIQRIKEMNILMFKLSKNGGQAK